MLMNGEYGKYQVYTLPIISPSSSSDRLPVAILPKEQLLAAAIASILSNTNPSGSGTVH